MTQEEIIEGNKLIAEFMFGGVATDGYKYNTHKEWTIHLSQSFCDTIEKYSPMAFIFANGLKFHSSWDWLMPVVEKIEEAGYDVHIDPKHRCVIFNGNENLLIDKSSGISKIEVVWLAVVEFIKWYNQQK